MNTEEMKAYKEKKRKRKNKIRIVIALVLLCIVWGYSAYVLWQKHIEYTTTTWYEVKAYYESSDSYETKEYETITDKGVTKTVYGLTKRYKVFYAYMAKDGSQYYYVEDSSRDSYETSVLTLLVDEEDPKHRIKPTTFKMQKIAVFTVSGALTFLILFTLSIRYQRKPQIDIDEMLKQMKK